MPTGRLPTACLQWQWQGAYFLPLLLQQPSFPVSIWLLYFTPIVSYCQRPSFPVSIWLLFFAPTVTTTLLSRVSGNGVTIW